MDVLIGWLLAWLGPILLGSGAWWLSNKVRGRNGQKALRYVAFGFWSSLLRFILPLLVPGLLGGLVGWLALIVPICFFLAAGNSMLKEMRSQQRGEQTERAL